MKIITLLAIITLAHASEKEFLDQIIQNIGDRWDIGFVPGNDFYYIRTKEKYNVQLTGGNHLFGNQNINVYGSFKIYRYSNDQELLQDRSNKTDRFKSLLEKAKSIQQENQMGWIQFSPKDGEQLLLVKEIMPLQEFMNAYPEYHYKENIYVAHVNWPEMYPSDDKANVIYGDISRINKLLRNVVK